LRFDFYAVNKLGDIAAQQKTARPNSPKRKRQRVTVKGIEWKSTGRKKEWPPI